MFLIEEFIAIVILALVFSAALLVVVSWLMVVRQEIQWLGRASVCLATRARHLANSFWHSAVTR